MCECWQVVQVEKTIYSQHLEQNKHTSVLLCPFLLHFRCACFLTCMDCLCVGTWRDTPVTCWGASTEEPRPSTTCWGEAPGKVQLQLKWSAASLTCGCFCLQLHPVQHPAHRLWHHHRHHLLRLLLQCLVWTHCSHLHGALPQWVLMFCDLLFGQVDEKLRANRTERSGLYFS